MQEIEEILRPQGDQQGKIKDFFPEEVHCD